MTREEARQAAEVMMAYADGKEIEFNNCDIENNHHWEEAAYPVFDWCHSKYRVKSETKYRPFRTRRECWDEMLKHQPFGWLKSKENEFCINIGEVSWKEGYGDVVITFYTSKPFSLYSNAAYREYTFADGAPFGIKED